MYTPKPKDFSNINLSDDLIAVSEAIARNVHEVWSENRIEQGWTFGPERNDRLKKHPNLVPYEQLEDSEKIMDRETAVATLKSVISMGFKIEKINS